MIDSSFRSAPVKAVIAIGTDCSRSSTRRAVTMISSNAIPVSACWACSASAWVLATDPAASAAAETVRNKNPPLLKRFMVPPMMIAAAECG